MKKTFLELENIDRAVGDLYKKNPALRNSKFGYGYKKYFDKNVLLVFKERNERLADIYVENALEDKETQQILEDAKSTRGFKFNKIGFKKVIELEKQIAKEFEEKEIEIEPYFIKPENLPDLNEETLELIKGILVE